MNIREYLQQTEFAGTTLYQIAIWIFIAACALLAIMLLRRFFRWITSGSSSKSTPATKTQPRPEMQRDRDQPAVTLTSDDSRQSFARSADSLLKDETSGDQRVLAPAEDSIFRDERDEVDEPMPVLSSEESMVKESSQPQRTFQVASSKETREYTGKQRSWTSRSLFGKPITGQQVDLPRVSSSDIPFADRSDYRYGSSLTPALASLMPETDERKAALKKDLIQAGYYTPHAYDNFAAARYLGLMAPILIFGGLLILAPPAIEWIFILLIVVGAGLGWAMPRVFIRSKAAQRRKEIENALPDVIDLLNMCVSQGMTLRSALARVSWEISETYPAMSEELRIVAEQADLSTTEHALMNLNERVDVPELHSLSSLLIQTERMGTNVSDSLTEYSDGMRATLQQRADQKANAATFKLLFPTVLCLMPAVFMFLLGPAVVDLSDFFQRGGVNQFNQVETDR
ncbi:type II secretion system F family protein [Rubinisphaera italica]|uniref:Bacterial type II secretion system protein F domain protein n=1 Tax=Rubinisphaera italica TaxID=2527969 RepID=A0A5C5XCA9_9PLAN|nr:type II secretion system F family protein [Rubinisphaera italica]TWT59552.1 Bacterial type II secretion system protein F domain protein [Rubinisphaera italica]